MNDGLTVLISRLQLRYQGVPRLLPVIVPLSATNFGPLRTVFARLAMSLIIHKVVDAGGGPFLQRLHVLANAGKLLQFYSVFHVLCVIFPLKSLKFKEIWRLLRVKFRGVVVVHDLNVLILVIILMFQFRLHSIHPRLLIPAPIPTRPNIFKIVEAGCQS